MKPIIINNFQKGIADSPHLGFADMRNIDVSSKPGVAQLTYQMQARTPSPVSTTFTVNTGTEVVTLVSGTFRDANINTALTGRAVTVSSTGTLPAPLVAGTVYFIIDVSSSTLQLATTYENSQIPTVIDLTTTGTGTHTITSVDIGIPKFFAYDSYAGILYAQDSNARVWFMPNGLSIWFLRTGNTLTNASAQGISMYQNYLFAFRSNKIDVFGPSTSLTPSWTNGWATLSGQAGEPNNHYSLVGQDDILYFADRNTSTGIPYVGSISHTGTFDPSNAATYTVTLQALTLPSQKTITCLDELGTNLMIGTVGREIYPWNRTDTTFKYPILAAEDGIKAMRTLNNILYFSAGTRGNIYETVGSSTATVRRLPISITNIPTNTVTIGAMVGHKGKLFFTVQCVGASGIYSIDLSNDVLVLEHQLSNGNYGTLNPMTLPCLYSFGAESLIAGWKDADNTLYGIDNTVSADFYPSYTGYFDSQLYETGHGLENQTFNTVLVELTKPLTTGQGVRVSYRKNLSASFTVFATFDFATYGAEMDFVAPAPITDTAFVQIRTELTVAASAQATPEVKFVMLN